MIVSKSDLKNCDFIRLNFRYSDFSSTKFTNVSFSSTSRFSKKKLNNFTIRKLLHI
ncbi:MAG TPA: hypothetical protein DCO79_10400 [Spirochaeta sp.]|nr:hypothetical protein [Spirochaeta sp.]